MFKSYKIRYIVSNGQVHIHIGIYIYILSYILHKLRCLLYDNYIYMNGPVTIKDMQTTPLPPSLLLSRMSLGELYA